MKKLFLLFVLMLLPLAASADDSGKCGYNVYYSYNAGTHTLTISGEGEMENFYNTEDEWGGFETEIPWYSHVSEILSINIESGVTSIGRCAFMNCTSLTSITIPNSVTSIGIYAFQNCSGLTSITIPNSVTDIGSRAFYNCSGLTSITIPNSVTTIGDAFYGCSGLTSITIPNSVTSIRVEAFYGCSGLTSIQVESGNQFYDSRNNCNAIIDNNNQLIVGCKNTIIPNSVTSIGNHAFIGCSGLTSITIPNSITSIGYGAFSGCSGLTSVTIPNSLATIESLTFSGCSGLISVTIPNSVTSIGSHAFYNCSGLTSITIPNSVTSIHELAFSGCSGLTSIKVESDNQYYDSRNNCNAIIDSNNQLIVGCKNTIIPNSVTSIGNFAFHGCTSLTSITIPNSVTSIGDEAFFGCAGMIYVTFPSNLTSIGTYAFADCNSLTDIYCKAVNVPSANPNGFFINPENIILHVPNESLNAYQTADPWKWYKFKNYVSLSSSDIQASAKCSKPTISIVDGRFVFNCETSNVIYNWSISTPYGNNGNGGSVPSSITLNVYATKSGYQPSEVATYEFSGLVGDVNNDGEVNVADHVKLSDIILNK